jgi:uncharacterized protein Usg
MTGKKLIRPDELSANDIARAKAIIRQSWETAQLGLSSTHYGLVTADISYFVTYGSKNNLVRASTFVWQDYDVLPTCPMLDGFLRFWQKSIDGQIYNIKTVGAPRLAFAELGMSSRH